MESEGEPVSGVSPSSVREVFGPSSWLDGLYACLMADLHIRRVREADAVLRYVVDRQPLSVDIVDRVERTR